MSAKRKLEKINDLVQAQFGTSWRSNTITTNVLEEDEDEGADIAPGKTVASDGSEPSR
jgi:hypothetical protein